MSKDPLDMHKLISKYTIVELPNGGHAEIQSMGFMKLSKNMTLEDVLYVPSFKLNLLSISKLTQALNCNVTFYLILCDVGFDHEEDG